MSHIVDSLNACKNSKERKTLLKTIKKHIAEVSKHHVYDFMDQIIVPNEYKNTNIVSAYRSKKFLATIYGKVKGAVVRISVNRVDINDDGTFKDGISWDELMWIKDQVGYGEYDAVEVYPRNDDLVNVANIRHLFVTKDDLEFVWR